MCLCICFPSAYAICPCNLQTIAMVDTISAHARTFTQVRKNNFSEIMGFIRLFGTTYLKKV